MGDYLLSDSASELERLRLQARVWEPATEAWLDGLGIQPGWRCLDLGCGAMGVLGPLSRRVGPGGQVAGADLDPLQLKGARAYVREEGLANVEIVEADVFGGSLPSGGYDLVHARFMFAPLGRDAELLGQFDRLVRPGGIVASQEPDSAAWSVMPDHPSFERLKALILAAFRAGGGDFDAGRRTAGTLRARGYRDVRVRAAIVALQDQHPYLRLPIQFATSLRPRILAQGSVSEAELDSLIADCEALAADPETIGTTFTVTQVSGRKV